MGKRGFQQRGYPNPLLIRKKPAPSQPTDKSIKNYLSRPRPTLAEVAQVVAAKEYEGRGLAERMAVYERAQGKDEREMLDKYRAKVLRREEKKRRKEEKRKKRQKREDKRGGKVVSEEDRAESQERKTRGNSPVQLSKFFSLGDDESDGEIPLSDEETETPSTSTTSTTMNATNTMGTTAASTSENTEPRRKKRNRWDEKPAIFQNQAFPASASTPLLPLPYLPHLHMQLPLSSLLTPVQPNIQLLQHQLQIQQQIQLRQATHPAQQILLQPTLTLPLHRSTLLNHVPLP